MPLVPSKWHTWHTRPAADRIIIAEDLKYGYSTQGCAHNQPPALRVYDVAFVQVYRPINPKAVTRNELYGFLHPTTREWKEGLVSVTFREMANNTTNKHQWIVLDGDIDAGV